MSRLISESREDRERRSFLTRLDNAAATVDVTDWEAQFIEDHLRSPRAFTRAQRDQIDYMRTQYEASL